MLEIRDKENIQKSVDRQIFSILFALIDNNPLSISTEIAVEGARKQILSISELAIVNRDAEPPELPKMLEKIDFPTITKYYRQGQQDMVNQGWVKEVKDDTD